VGLSLFFYMWHFYTALLFFDEGSIEENKEKISMEEGIFSLFGLVIAVVIGVLIGRDASSRGMNGLGWGIFSFLICIVAVPIYLIVRKPAQE
jgi:uncharacterized protein YacL